MDELQNQYRMALPARIAALALARDMVDEEPEAKASLRRMAHRLRGSGGTYGFPEISEAAAAVEDAGDPDLLHVTDVLLSVLRAVAADGTDSASRILVVEDEPTSALLVEATLDGAGRGVVVAHTLAEAERALDEYRVALVVLDLVLPDGDGRSFLVQLRDRPDTATVPVIVLSGKIGPGPKAECFALGADTFIEKPVQPDVLRAAAAAKLESVTTDLPLPGRDPLTDRLNRSGLRDVFVEILDRCREERRPLSVALLGLDGFLDTVERFGAGAAETALARAADLVDGALGTDDLVGRWGGAEFLALLPGMTLPVATKAVERAVAAVAATPMQAPGGAQFSVTFSAGVAGANPDRDLDGTLEELGRLLHLARREGPGRVNGEDAEVAEPAPTVVVAEDDPLVVSLLRHRLEREGFRVVVFEDGANLVEAAAGLRPSVAILDVKMPGLDGFHVLQRLRATPSFAGVPVLMLTSMGSERDIVRAFELGADDYVLKPFSPVELLARVRRLVEDA